MLNLPVYVNAAFIVTTLLTVWLFFKAANRSTITILILSTWLAVQTILALTGFYTVTGAVPPRFILVLFPPIFLIVILFVSRRGKQYIAGIDVKALTLLHIVRIPVELILYGLCIYKAVPQLMTFEGRNFDILSGLSAPFIYYFGFIKKQLGRKVMLLWNFICLGLLINIVVSAILSAPFPFQQFAFNQPNIAILYFPFIWLPCCIVPLVLLAHLAAIRQLIKNDKKELAG